MDKKRLLRQKIGLDAQKIGREAERRVCKIANGLNLDVEYKPESDYGAKVDIYINGIPFQISCSGKSRNATRALRKRGVHLIVAGSSITEQEIIRQIIEALREIKDRE